MSRKTSNKTNIAIVVNTTWNIYNFRLGLAKVLIDKGFGVIAIAPRDEYVKEIEKIGCKFVELKLLGRKGKNPIKDLLLINELRNIYKNENVNIALHYTIKPVIYGSIAAKYTNTKSINTMTGLGFAFLSKGLVSKVVLGLYRYSLRIANKVLFQNIDDQELFINKKLVSKNKTDIVNGSGINADYFQSNSYPIVNKVFNILFIGRLLKDKGIFELIEASKSIHSKYPFTKFTFVGGVDFDNPASVSEKQLLKLKDKKWLDFLGVVKDTRPVIENAHIVVLPSYREGVPRGLLEAMSMRRPIITTDVPGCRETIIDSENGFLIPVKDSLALARSIERMLLLDQGKRIEMGEKGREIAIKRFDESIIIKKYLLEIEKLCSI